jgi:hypothetical protein
MEVSGRKKKLTHFIIFPKLSNPSLLSKKELWKNAHVSEDMLMCLKTFFSRHAYVSEVYESQ